MNPYTLPLCFFIAVFALARPVFADLAGLQNAWAEAMYRTPPEQREAALQSLTDTARTEVTAHPEDAALLIWQGIILSTYAGEKGGLGALSLVKEARHSLEQSLALDPVALNGSAQTSLGSLYYKVPGWPIGFGSDKQAHQHLEEALKINPGGIDPNYFMGELLFEQGDYASARRYLDKALDAPDRPGRALADSGRRDEIRALLARVDEHLH